MLRECKECDYLNNTNKSKCLCDKDGDNLTKLGFPHKCDVKTVTLVQE